MKPRLLYVSFDIVPAPKGAAVHIEQFAQILANKFESLQLATVAPTNDVWQIQHRSLSPQIEQVLIPAPGSNLIDRVGNFRRFLEAWWGDKYFDLVHFRSPFEAYWLCAEKQKRCGKMVFEVNGLPSVELKYRYPRVAEDTVFIEKLIGQEFACMQAADLVLTPSKVTADFLVTRGCASDKIRVIPNSVDLSTFHFEEPHSLEENEPLRLLYFGTLNPWQGVEQAIAAVSHCSKQMKVHLKIVAAAKVQQIDALNQLRLRLGVQDIVSILPPCNQEELVGHIHDAHLVLAPLTANDRNIQQGCCPFKILEGMAAGRPVLASSLPVVMELASDDAAVYLCKPGSAGSIADALIDIRKNPKQLLEMALKARKLIENNYALDSNAKLLCDAYSELLSTRLSTSSS